MQFGKFHAWAFLALGALLIVVQVALYFTPRGETSTAIERPAPQKVSPLPGIVGGLALITGVGLFVSQKNKPQA